MPELQRRHFGPPISQIFPPTSSSYGVGMRRLFGNSEIAPREAFDRRKRYRQNTKGKPRKKEKKERRTIERVWEITKNTRAYFAPCLSQKRQFHP
ncbi:no significant blast hit [Histoplasma capsulatum var. duboisii H88]|uniref:No significant blast hit n=1 Tax=Ajellomyces capsulatus (strain H88) TaxID=544711 RepID=A0A8A1L583_AJEC8|nr:no significant blast hit [Histoplasma capsulatum var. duboisii H88]